MYYTMLYSGDKLRGLENFQLTEHIDGLQWLAEIIGLLRIPLAPHFK